MSSRVIELTWSPEPPALELPILQMYLCRYGMREMSVEYSVRVSGEE